MSGLGRRLLLLILAAVGLWILYRLLMDRAERSSGLEPEPPRLNTGRLAPALPPAPVSELDAFRAERPVDIPTTTSAEPEETPVVQMSSVVPSTPDRPVAEAVPVAPAARPVVPDTSASVPAEAVPTEPEAAPTEPEAAPTEPATTANLDRVRERLASIHVDLPPVRSGTASVESGAAKRSRRPRRSDRWKEPAPDGTCDQTHPIKVKVRSGLFHLPGMFAYDRTKADRCYRSSADAEADGFTRAQR